VEVYRLIGAIRKQDRIIDLWEFVIKKHGQPKDSRTSANDFYWGMMLAFGKNPELISTQNRSKYAHMLDYAAQNEVPWQLVVGFIYQSGVYELIREKQRACETEPGFDKLIEQAQGAKA